MKFSRRTKNILLNGLSVLALNLVLFQREWGEVLFGVIIFIIGALIYPYLITFMSNDKQDNRYK